MAKLVWSPRAIDDLAEILQNYRIVYRVRGEIMEVVSIVHGARLLPTDLLDG